MRDRTKKIIGILCCVIAISAVFAIFIMAYGFKPSLIAFGIATPIILLALLGGFLISG